MYSDEHSSSVPYYYYDGRSYLQFSINKL